MKAVVLAKPLNPAFIEQMARKTQRKYRKQLFNRDVVARPGWETTRFFCVILLPSLPLPLLPFFLPSLPPQFASG